MCEEWKAPSEAPCPAVVDRLVCASLLCHDDAGLLDDLDDGLDGAAEDLLAFAEIGVAVDLDLPAVALRVGEVQALLAPLAAVRLAVWLCGAALRARRAQWEDDDA